VVREQPIVKARKTVAQPSRNLLVREQPEKGSSSAAGAARPRSARASATRMALAPDSCAVGAGGPGLASGSGAADSSTRARIAGARRPWRGDGHLTPPPETRHSRNTLILRNKRVVLDNEDEAAAARRQGSGVLLADNRCRRGPARARDRRSKVVCRARGPSRVRNRRCALQVDELSTGRRRASVRRWRG